MAQLPNVRLGMVRPLWISPNIFKFSFHSDASSLSRFGPIWRYERSRSSTQSALLCHWSMSIPLTIYSVCSFFIASQRIYFSLLRFESHLTNRHYYHAQETCGKDQWVSWQSSFTRRTTRTTEISRMWGRSVDSKCSRHGTANIEVTDTRVLSFVLSFLWLDICQNILVERCFSFSVVSARVMQEIFYRRSK